MEDLKQTKKFKWEYAIIIILVIAVTVLITLQFTKKKDNDKESTPTPSSTITPTPQEEIALDVKGAEVANLFVELDNSRLKNDCGNYAYFSDSKLVATDLSNEIVFDMARRSMNVHPNSDTSGKNFTKQQLDEKIKSFLGSTYQFKHEDYLSCPDWNYNSATETYEYDDTNCGNVCSANDIKRVEKAVKKGSIIEAYVRVVFAPKESSNETGVPTYYKDFQRTIAISNIERNDRDRAVQSDANFQNGSLYKVVFKQENGNYIFESSELAK